MQYELNVADGLWNNTPYLFYSW